MIVRFPLWANRSASAKLPVVMQHPIASAIIDLDTACFHPQTGNLRTQIVRALASSNFSNSVKTITKRPYRPWLDRRLDVETRVRKFIGVELGALGWEAVAFDSVDLADNCCRHKDFDGMKRAHDILERCLAEKRQLDSNRSSPVQGPFFVPYMLFQKILYGWAIMAPTGEASRHRMRELVDLLVQVAREEKEIFKDGYTGKSPEGFRLQPTTHTYNTYLAGLRNAASWSGKAAATAGTVLDEMINNHRKHGWHTKPNTRTYSLILNAFGNSTYKDSGRIAEKYLRRMQKAHQEGKEEYLADHGVPYNTKDPAANKRKIVTADAIAYGHVIRAYARDPSETSAGKARDLLLEVMDVEDGTVKPDLGLLSGTLSAFASVAGNARISKTRRYSAAQQAEEILETWLSDMEWSDLESQMRDSPDMHLVAPYNACMNAWAKCDADDAALKAEAMLQRLLSNFTEGRSSISPDTISFNTVLHGWARSCRKIPDAPRKAEELMRLQIQLVESEVLPESARPDKQTFSIVMSAYAKSNHVNKVTNTYRLLHELLEGIAGGKVSPDSNLVVAFTAVLDAAAYPPRQQAPKETFVEGTIAPGATKSPAVHTSERIKNSSVGERTNAIHNAEGASTDTTSPSACSGALTIQLHASNHSTAFEDTPKATSGSDDYNIALQAYRELKDDVFQIGCQPDHFAFAKMILVVTAHTYEKSIERRQMIQLVFEDACQAGEVSRLVLQSILNLKADKSFLAALLKNNDMLTSQVYMESVDQLPRAWTRNVPRKYRHMKRLDVRNNDRRFIKF